MKVLFIQLARLGDVLLTIPTIRAFKRKHPEAQIDLLVRTKFAAMADLFEEDLANIIRFDTGAVLGPLLEDAEDIDTALKHQEEFVESLKGKYEKIVNFSYSPYSSYLVDAIDEEAELVGYSRFADGSLNIVDDLSAYIYSQVGPGMANRYHLSDLFASALDLDLETTDRRVDVNVEKFQLRTDFAIDDDYLVLHVGASQSTKTYPIEKWRIVIARVLSRWHGKIVLVGSNQEQERAEAILKDLQNDSVINLVGKTQIGELFGLIAGSKLLLGADSVPIHIATMVNTPVVNLSFASVNFWETGPLSDNSRVLFALTPAELMSEAVANEACYVLQGSNKTEAFALFRPGQPCYGLVTVGMQQFEWEFIRALYTGEIFPEIDEHVVYQGFYRLAEANQIIVEQLEKMESGVDPKHLMPLIERSEEIIGSIKLLVRQVAPLISWLQTEKSRIGPLGLQEVVSEYLRIHKSLDEVVRYFVDIEKLEEIEGDSKSVLK